MSNDHVNAFRGIIGACIVGLLLWALMGWGGYGLWKFLRPCPTVKAEKSYLADRWTVARHKYHGIHTSVYDPATREAWFYNKKKQRCRL